RAPGTSHTSRPSAVTYCTHHQPVAMLTTSPARVAPAMYAQVMDSAMSARRDGLSSVRLTRRLACARTGMTTTATALTATPSRDDSGITRSTRPARENSTTYAHSAMSSTAELRVATAPPAL